MTFLRPAFRHPDLPVNTLGYTRKFYEGSLTTLCAGCGHDSISAAITQAAWELSLEPHKVAKLSGIGCSSKTPAYFLGNSHGFNSVHGRMPSVATGAALANKELRYLGVSGDGDTASIGMGQFVHAVRRNLSMLYIVENNGCYGLTKGQDSATTDLGSQSRKGDQNAFHGIDLVALALELGAPFVARSFSGDKTQLIPLIRAALLHHGFAFIDVISPCVTFNNNPGSTKSYDYVREHIEATSMLDFVPITDEITTEYEEGGTKELILHDGSSMFLRKLGPDFDPTDRRKAFESIRQAEAAHEILTGLIYFDASARDMHDILGTTATPLNRLTEDLLCPGSKALPAINTSFR